MLKLSPKDENWANEIWQKIEGKMSTVIKRSGDKIPYTTENGVFDDKYLSDADWWTNGFWSGIVWLMYLETKDEYYKELENRLEKRLDKALYSFDGLHHDVGFMWLLSSVANYRITKNDDSRKRGLVAASILSARYNIKGDFITAWNDVDRAGWTIIDCMMNLPLLYWATDVSGYERYKEIAIAHANKSMKTHIREDGSVNHIVSQDTVTGEVIETFGGQGFSVGSSWTRGQSWAIYGYALSYIHTNDEKYLDVAKKVANYFIAAVSDNDYIPKIDFRAKETEFDVDTTAGAIAACGIIEIAKNVPEFEKKMYLNAAIKILKALEAKYCDFSDNSDAITNAGTEAYFTKKNMNIIYGDYYFMEAILKLRGMDINLW